MKDKENRQKKNKQLKEYHGPVIVSERIYEENALACGKNPAIRRTAQCRLNAQS